ncbi:MAG TPA: MotA/TolQ/ExbB proton channel family protein [Gemmatimonadales bacterium]|nr:MotA/TolQ/ExbB proton channel family protein [Gemmatimonadales bacterium]
MLLQADVGVPKTALDLVLESGPETLVILGITALLSLASWFIIAMKWWQFRRINRQSVRFFQTLETSTGVREAYRSVMKLPQSAYNRLFKEGMSFYTEINPGVMTEAAERGKFSLSDAQLEALKLVLGKEVAAERDAVAHYVPWLATVGAVSPLLGLLGTVLGVMDAFIGIASSGSGNLAAIAPGVAKALVTTVAGLAVAIPAVMAYNFFAGRVGRFEGELEGFGNALIGWMAREGLL